MRAPLLLSEVQLDVDVDGCDQSQEVCVSSLLSHCVGPALCQVDDLTLKFTSQESECVCDRKGP